MRTVLMVVAVFLLGGWVMAKEKNTAQDSRIGNLSKLRREQLSAKVSEIRSYLLEASIADTNAARLLSFVAELEKEVRSKKYGLIFEGHKERVDIELEENIPVLAENKKRFIDNGGEMNFLIEGDNLAALKLLEKTHRGKIDLIYIDPPYNTGNKDFIYNDSFVDKTDGYRHSKWLSFMEKRLNIAKRLLSQKGVIFISIDDNEQANLKLLCDGILGESNFVNQFIWKRNSSGKTEKDKFTVNTEYVLLYRKSSSCVLNAAYKPLAESSVKLYKHDDNDGRGKYQTVSLQKPSAPGPETTYDYIDNCGRVWKCPPKGWRMTYEKVKALENDNRLCFNGKTLRVKDYWNERANEGKRIDTLWIDLPENTVATKELSLLFDGEVVFTNPKPTDLIKRCLEVGYSNYAILDFFAGSGTTGHAVMKLNSEDGGKRKFILVTNNENGICEKVTYERLKRVINKEKYAAKLKYFKVDYVPITEEGYWERAEALLKYIRELVELENGIDFVHDKSVAIVLTDEEAVALLKDRKRLAVCKTVYRGHNVMFSAKMNAQLSSCGIEVRMIPDYYYPELED